jgi:hypothetical protein
MCQDTLALELLEFVDCVFLSGAEHGKIVAKFPNRSKINCVGSSCSGMLTEEFDHGKNRINGQHFRAEAVP